MFTAGSSARSQGELVSHLLQEDRLSNPRVREAFSVVDRRHFVAPGTPESAIYADHPLPIGEEQTISAPHMHAACLDLLADHLRPGAASLDVGSGSGFLTAVMGLLVSPGGHVEGVEKIEDLAARSVDSVKASHPELLEDGTVKLRAGNALSGILDDESAKYDAIHVGAAAATMPENLVRKLKRGGRMVRISLIIPVGRQQDYQVLCCVDKDVDTGKVKETDLMYVRYVPLL